MQSSLNFGRVFFQFQINCLFLPIAEQLKLHKTFKLTLKVFQKMIKYHKIQSGLSSILHIL